MVSFFKYHQNNIWYKVVKLFLRRRSLKYLPIRKFYSPCQQYLIINGHQNNNTWSGPYKVHFSQIWLQSIQHFLRRRLKYEKVLKTDNGRMPGDRNSSHDSLGQVSLKLPYSCHKVIISYPLLLHTLWVKWAITGIYNMFYLMFNLNETRGPHNPIKLTWNKIGKTYWQWIASDTKWADKY